MDWINCNSCFIQPGNGRKFHLTSCGHIYCDSCVVEKTKNNCFMCNQKCTTFQLSNQMSPDIDMYFYDYSEITKQFRKGIVESIDQKLAKLDKVYNFQNSHRLHFQKHLLAIKTKQQELEQKQSQIEQKQQQMEQKMKYYYEKMKQLEEENNYLKSSMTYQVQNDLKKFSFNDEPPVTHKPPINNNSVFSSNFEPFHKSSDFKPTFQNSDRPIGSSSSNSLKTLFNAPSSHSISSAHNTSKTSSDSKYFTLDNSNHMSTSSSNINVKPYIKNISNQSIRDIILSFSQNKQN